MVLLATPAHAGVSNAIKNIVSDTKTRIAEGKYSDESLQSIYFDDKARVLHLIHQENELDIDLISKEKADALHYARLESIKSVCSGEHKALIYNGDITFRYTYRDSKERLVDLVDINSITCASLLKVDEIRL